MKKKKKKKKMKKTPVAIFCFLHRFLTNMLTYIAALGIHLLRTYIIRTIILDLWTSTCNNSACSARGLCV